MRREWIALLACASAMGLGSSAASGVNFAETVVSYTPGMGFATEFGSGLGYTNAAAALGEPSRSIPGPFGGPVDPFNPPYTRDQLVSIGEGGSLTVAFANPIPNSDAHPFGIDFIVFGSAGFVITNGNFTGGGITDGSLFGANPGATRVSVSADNVRYYTLDPARAPGVDAFFPTDGAGQFNRPVNPALRNSDFAGLGLDRVRARYGGSAGGAGFDLSWAQDSDGQRVFLPEARYVRIDVLSETAEIDGFAAVSGETTLVENFASDPFDRGWVTFGDAELFCWDSAAQNLRVTWDSASANSYFYRPLGTVLGKNDDLELSFDLQIEEIAVGIHPEKPFTFELALGLINVSQATGPGFLRGTGSQSPNLLEFDYFPDSGYGATVWPVIISSNSQFTLGFTVLPLEPGAEFHITMRYTAANQTLATTIHRGAETLGPVKDVTLGANFTDFQVDAVSINSYSDEGAGGSLLAKGIIDNLALSFPAPPAVQLRANLVDGVMHAAFTGHPNWLFTLERTVDWKEWRPISAAVSGSGELVLQDETRSAPAGAFYRVRAEKASSERRLAAGSLTRP